MQMEGRTHGFCYIHVRGGNLLALLVSDFHLSHIPDAEGCTIELRPDVAPSFVLVRLVAIWVPVEFMNERTREIDFLRVCHSERDDRTNFWVEGGIIGRRRLLVLWLLWLRGLGLLWWCWRGVLWLRLRDRRGPLGGWRLWRWRLRVARRSPVQFVRG